MTYVFDWKGEMECYECTGECLRDMCGLWCKLPEITLDQIWFSGIFIFHNLQWLLFNTSIHYFLAACSFTRLRHIYSWSQNICDSLENSTHLNFTFSHLISWGVLKSDSRHHCSFGLSRVRLTPQDWSLQNFLLFSAYLYRLSCWTVRVQRTTRAGRLTTHLLSSSWVLGSIMIRVVNGTYYTGVVIATLTLSFPLKSPRILTSWQYLLWSLASRRRPRS